MLTALRSRCSSLLLDQSWKLSLSAPNRIIASSPSFSSTTGFHDVSEVLTLPEVEKILADVKADNVTVIPTHNHCFWADFTVIATGRSDWHLRNIAQALVYRVHVFTFFYFFNSFVEIVDSILNQTFGCSHFCDKMFKIQYENWLLGIMSTCFVNSFWVIGTCYSECEHYKHDRVSDHWFLTFSGFVSLTGQAKAARSQTYNATFCARVQ